MRTLLSLRKLSSGRAYVRLNEIQDYAIIEGKNACFVVKGYLVKGHIWKDGRVVLSRETVEKLGLEPGAKTGREKKYWFWKPNQDMVKKMEPEKRYRKLTNKEKKVLEVEVRNVRIKLTGYFECKYVSVGFTWIGEGPFTKPYKVSYQDYLYDYVLKYYEKKYGCYANVFIMEVKRVRRIKEKMLMFRWERRESIKRH